MTVTITVQLIVKTYSQSDARDKVTRRLNEWFLDPVYNDLIIGYGYPDGALLHWRFEDADLATD